MLYANDVEASNVPPDWHAWMHHTVQNPPNDDGQEHKPWEKDHRPNPTFTEAAYRPPGHTLKGGNRDRATGDYEPWIPG